MQVFYWTRAFLVKFNGYRALAFSKGNESELVSRNNNRLTSEFADIGERLRQLESGLILDGEIVALDERGRPSFNALQNRGNKKLPIFYYVFDLIGYRDRSLIELPLSKRRELLEAIAHEFRDPIRVSGTLHAKPTVTGWRVMDSLAAERSITRLTRRRSSVSQIILLSLIEFRKI